MSVPDASTVATRASAVAYSSRPLAGSACRSPAVSAISLGSTTAPHTSHAPRPIAPISAMPSPTAVSRLPSMRTTLESVLAQFSSRIDTPESAGMSGIESPT